MLEAMRGFVLAFVAWLVCSATARAVVVFGSDDVPYTTAPGNGAPWDHVGTIGGATGVYLGSFGGGYWVITATHVGAGSFTLGSGTYSVVSGSAAQISGSDLTVFRVATNPGLSNLTLSSSAPATGASVTMIGHGLDRTTSPLTGQLLAGWQVTGSDPNYTWTEISSGVADAEGYYLGSSHTMRWGTNTIAGTSSYNIGTGNTTALVTNFSAVTGESQGSSGDSGGAMFYFNGSTWELTGIMGAIATFEDQPGSTAVVGNLTYSASIAAYNSAIVSAIPEPATTTAWLAAAALILARARRKSRAGL